MTDTDVKVDGAPEDRSYLSEAQREQLLKPINPKRVGVRDGNAHLEVYDVRAHLNRCFGFARWSADVIEVERLYEEVGPHPDPNKTHIVVSVGYRATLRLIVCAPDGTQLASYSEVACGDATNFPINKRADAHDFAVKTAESQALKRCAINLGDQFGLSLYAKGSTRAVVGATLVPAPPTTAPKQDVQPDEHVAAESLERGMPDREGITTSNGAAKDEPPAPEPAPEPPDPEQVERATTAAAQALWDKAIAARDMPKKDAMPLVTKVMAEAGRLRLSNALIDVDGNVVALGRQLDHVLQVIGQRA